MRSTIENKIEKWKKLLLDMGRRNALIHLNENAAGCLKITSPDMREQFRRIVADEEQLAFPYAGKITFDENGEEQYENHEPGDLQTSLRLGDLFKKLKWIRSKARDALNEQGVNTLYLAFGGLRWNVGTKQEEYFSPILLVPAILSIESLISPYKIENLDDDIAVNPALSYKLSIECGVQLPDYEVGTPAEDYLAQLNSIIENRGWSIEENVYLALFSFQNLSIYEDLEKNAARLKNHAIVSQLATSGASASAPDVALPIDFGEGEWGDADGGGIPTAGEIHTAGEILNHVAGALPDIPPELKDYDHDKRSVPEQIFQVLDADSSQMDALLLARNGVSFVLQGPPGTGKSQTIANIICEALAEGKKVLFVAERLAALQVVYKRLQSVGLGDFCLQLHGQRQRKKELLKELAAAVSLESRGVKEDALAQLASLQRIKPKLYEYQEQLHTPTSLLRKSVYEVIGEIAIRTDVPEVVFDIEAVEEFTRDRLGDIVGLLSDLTRLIEKQTMPFDENPWRNTIIEQLTYDLRQNIMSHCRALVPYLEESHQIFQESQSVFQTPQPASWSYTKGLAGLLIQGGQSPHFSPEWVLEKKVGAMLQESSNWRGECEIIKTKREKVLEKFVSEFVESDCGEELCLLQRECYALASRLSETAWQRTNETPNGLEELRRDAGEIQQGLEALEEKRQALASALEVAPDSFDLQTWCNLGKFLNSKLVFPAIWFERPLQKWLQNLIALFNELAQEKKAILENFDPEVFELDIYPILKRFRMEYKSVLRLARGQYYRDRKLVLSCCVEPEKMTDRDIEVVLNRLKRYLDRKKALEESDPTFREVFGAYYNAKNTDWDLILARAQDALDLRNFFVDVPVPPRLKRIIAGGELPLREAQEFGELYEQLDIEALLERKKRIFSDETHSDPPAKQREALAKTLESLENLRACVDRLQESVKPECKDSITLAQVVECVANLEQARSLVKDFNEKKQHLEQLLGEYWNDLDTPWDDVANALQHAKRWEEYLAKNFVSTDFVEKVGSDSEFRSKILAKGLRLKEIIESASADFDWLNAQFCEKEDLSKIPLDKLTPRVQLCGENLALLDEQLHYKNLRDRAKEFALLDYIDQTERMDLPAKLIVDAYKKRFYRLWLDVVVPKFPAVHDFRSKVHEATIEDFCELDKDQLLIARDRVRDLVLSRYPDMDAMWGAQDEISIFKRALNKPGRRTPLRELFASIPNLLTKIKPCWMMSPLSVSVFLDADKYAFDLVIFDEASQVCSQNAVSSILRGRQVIIVGDTNQLPPTRFFSSSGVAADFDALDDLQDDDPGVSILEEASAALPQRSLLWHYRSRHEDLIAFSNIKIYDGRLVTFPSHQERKPGFGVEYIYVPEGVYDRGGKRHNLIEAQKTADLVFEHFKNFPERSLGVVTFSGAQMAAIESAIRKRRLADASFEEFFVEDRDEPFFIKNLENVQGDERDSMIFSIGYARDQEGKMSMNFGPLNKPGGYRRLNVAITRAKFNVKLVGSIVPADFADETALAEGVKMLRDYIDFARSGCEEMRLAPSVEQADSSFEEAVLRFIESSGYDAVANLGSSSYKIDVAVRHPIQRDKFILAVECDGNSYHRTRTVRERDRLRREVLESMGWSVYRVWSADWIKDPKTEGEKLLRAIREAEKRFS
ncbi:MAG: DUF4011 domain-containing protein [Planctomycetia bacterium]|nr:DUF4011 domain-containing protein [Planctomycetia bacterium]